MNDCLASIYLGLPRGHTESDTTEATQQQQQVVLAIKNSPVNAVDIRDAGSIPGLGRFHGEGNGSPLQYSFRESHGQRSQWAAVHGVAQNQTQVKRLSTHTPQFIPLTCKFHHSLNTCRDMNALQFRFDFKDMKINVSTSIVLGLTLYI